MSTRTGGLQLTHPWCVSWRAARSWPIRISLRRVWNSSAACSRYLHYSVSITFVWSVCFVCTIVHAYLLTFFSEKILWCIDTGLFLSAAAWHQNDQEKDWGPYHERIPGARCRCGQLVPILGLIGRCWLTAASLTAVFPLVHFLNLDSLGWDIQWKCGIIHAVYYMVMVTSDFFRNMFDFSPIFLWYSRHCFNHNHDACCAVRSSN